MRSVRAYQTSFAMGELSPSTAANQDAEWFDKGAQKMQNYIPLQSGAVIRRPGTFLYEIANENKRLQHFVSTSGQNLIVAIGTIDIRVYAPGSGLLVQDGIECIFPSVYSESHIPELDITQIDDRLYICHNNYSTRYIKIAANEIGLFLAVFYTNVWLSSSGYSEGDVVSYDGYDYIAITDTNAGDLPSDVVQYWRKIWGGAGLRGEGRATRIDPWFSGYSETWDDSKIVSFNQMATTDFLVPGSYVIWENAIWKWLKETGLDVYDQPTKECIDCPDALQYPEDHTGWPICLRWAANQFLFRWENYIDLGEEFPTVIDKWVSGSYVVSEFVYTESGVFKCIVDTTEKPDPDLPESAGKWLLIGPSAATLNDDPPHAMIWHNNRAIVIGSRSFPSRIWASKVNNIDNFYVGSLDSDSFQFIVSGTNGDPLVCGNGDKDLVIASSQSEIHITGSNGYVTATDIIARKETSVGASRVGMFESGASLLFVQRSGNRIFQTMYSNERQSYSIGDLSVLAEHLFKNSRIKQIAVQRTPELIIWAVLEDGTLLSGTHYVNSAQIAWAKHVTQGLYQSVCVLPARGREDQVWFNVQREDDNGVYYSLEYMDLWNGHIGTDMTQVQNNFNLAEGALTRLEGQTVQCLVDGARYADRVVENGSIILDPDGINLGIAIPEVNVGLGYDSILVPQTIEPFRTLNKSATRVVSVGIKMYEAAGVEVGVFDFDKINFRLTNDPMGVAVSPFSGEKRITVNSSFTDGQWISIGQFGPFRGRILGCFYLLQVGGEP